MDVVTSTENDDNFEDSDSNSNYPPPPYQEPPPHESLPPINPNFKTTQPQRIQLRLMHFTIHIGDVDVDANIDVSTFKKNLESVLSLANYDLTLICKNRILMDNFTLAESGVGCGNVISVGTSVKRPRK